MKIIYAILLMFFVAACNSNPSPIASTDSAFKTVVPKTPFINAEEYTGTLPCADCEDIEVSLQLNHDSSYTMNSVYKGSKVDSSNNHTIDNGTWAMNKDTLILLTNGNATKYISSSSTLTQLDDNGKIMKGPSSDDFILHKK